LFTGTFDNPNLSAVNPNTAEDLLMNPGDRILVHLHDTLAGFRVDETDLTTGQHGSMTASIANGFGHVLYTPNSSTCQVAPYAFHPEYSTANPRGTSWAFHTYNVAMSDEIGRVLLRAWKGTSAFRLGAASFTCWGSQAAWVSGETVPEAEFLRPAGHGRYRLVFDWQGRKGVDDRVGPRSVAAVGLMESD
jgi:hypothetical protein